jgi:ribose-phosphate pyrophosphokinase
MELGATEVRAACTHGVLSGNAPALLQDSCIAEVVLLNTIPLTDEKKAIAPKLVQLSISRLFAQAIERIYENKSLSTLFEIRHYRGSEISLDDQSGYSPVI